MTVAPVLETERLLLRGWRYEDLEQWAALCADDEVMRWLGYDGGIGAGEAWNEMAGLAGHWLLKGFGHWVLEERESGALVGRAGLLFPPDWPALELGWTVARPRWVRASRARPRTRPPPGPKRSSERTTSSA